MQKLEFNPAIEHPDLVCNSIYQLLENTNEPDLIEAVEVAEIDPNFAGGDNFCKEYGVKSEEGANCVIVKATRGDVSTIAACVAPVGHRIDFNGTVRKILNARRVSLAPLEEVLKTTGMEYGSITALGLPSNWKVLLDQRVMTPTKIIIGSGLLKAKLRLPGAVLAKLSSASMIEYLSTPKLQRDAE